MDSKMAFWIQNSIFELVMDVGTYTATGNLQWALLIYIYIFFLITNSATATTMYKMYPTRLLYYFSVNIVFSYFP